MFGSLGTSMKTKASSMFTSAINSLSDANELGRQGGYGEAAKYYGKSAGNKVGGVMSRHKGATAMASLGAGYGMASDDTSIVGGAMIGAGTGIGAGIAYGASKGKFAGLKSSLQDVWKS